MSKIHHAAYDAGLIGIDADLNVHVSERLLAMHDGPLLEQSLKALAGRKLRVPTDPLALPDRDRLDLRIQRLRSAAQDADQCKGKRPVPLPRDGSHAHRQDSGAAIRRSLNGTTSVLS